MFNFTKKLKAFTLILAAIILSFSASQQANAETITGDWKTPAGATVRIAPCGGSFCTTIVSGKFNGKKIGTFKNRNNKYVGTITDPKDDKTYEGSAYIKNGNLIMKGCALKIFCKSQVWKPL